MRSLHTIASLLLMASVLWSSTGVRFSQHWCGERLVSASIFGDAVPCSHYQAEEASSCPFHAKQAAKKKCCDQREALIDGNDYDYELQASNVLPSAVALAVIAYSNFVVICRDAGLAHTKFHNHSPPPIGSDILVRIQSFLL